MNELQMGLKLVVVACGNGLLAPEQGKVVGKGREEDPEKEACCCRAKAVSMISMSILLQRRSHQRDGSKIRGKHTSDDHKCRKGARAAVAG